jgi:GWxTD domain-containing protein
MTRDERIRLTSIQRVLSAEERDGFGVLPPDERDRAEERAWLLIDPMWRVPGNEVRSEFMARVAYAELRWGTGGAGHGVDSDPGAVWIAFGPPTVMQTLWIDQSDIANARATVSWRWRPDVQVHFRVDPGALEEHLPSGRRSEFDMLVGRRGVNWNGVPGVTGLDSIAVQSAFFRAGPDSADLFVAARIPTDRLSQGTATALALDLFILTNDGAVVRRDSSRWVLDSMQRRAPAIRVWRPRLARAAYLHRVEAYEPVEARGARGGSMPASIDDASFRLDGYGVSQVLVTQGVASRTGSYGDRWSDYNILPNPGALHRDGAVSLLWEVYGDSATSLQRYRVTVTLQPPAPAVARTLGLQVRSGIVGGAARRTRARDRVSVTFERQYPVGARVRVEQLDLGSVKVTPGVYVLRLDVVDGATQRVATTSRLVTVR